MKLNQFGGEEDEARRGRRLWAGRRAGSAAKWRTDFWRFHSPCWPFSLQRQHPRRKPRCRSRRGDAVDANSFLAELHHDRPGESKDGAFRRPIDVARHPAPMPGDAGDVDDAAGL